MPAGPDGEDKNDLRAAIAALSRAIEGSPGVDGNLADRIKALETRLEEQELAGGTARREGGCLGPG